MTAAPRPHATIFADASFCPKTGSAGWAAWMICGGKSSLTIGGRITAPAPMSYDAETFAAVNALYAARAAGYFTAGQVVMLQSDCLRALAIFRYFVPGTVESRHRDGLATTPIGKKKLKAPDKLALAAIEKLMAETPVKIVVRHVRGHQPGHGRAWVNEECDRLAKQHMRDARAKAQQGAA